ncbi:MAG TPA: PD-(D/E)XK nuclease family protein [Bacteroidales bacterium]|nr:PD-(D/E)XK nuclease family protein [Bacteroidales bacterium]
MIPFLQRTAAHLLTSFPDSLDELCVVLPNRRAGLFLRKYLAAATGRPIWTPTIYSIEDFAWWVSGLQESDPLHLLISLYRVYREAEGIKAQAFEEFLRWGPQLLSDFNEADRYLADPVALYTTLSEARAIALWNPDGTPLTDFEKSYLDFYRAMLIYYQGLNTMLLEQNEGGLGQAYRVAAEKAGLLPEELPWRHVVFAGFNALTRAEEVIIDRLREQGKATLLWDADRYYLDNESHEAGSFIREWKQKWPVRDFLWISDELASGTKEIHIIGSPDPVGQVRYCGEVLKELAAQGKADERTAVVLLDEGLLVPLLNAIPEQIESLNITAGLSLEQTPVAGLFDIIFRMHLRKTGPGRGESGSHPAYYYKDVLKLLQHPYVRKMPEGDRQGKPADIEALLGWVRTGQRVFVGIRDLAGPDPDLFTPSLGFLEGIFTPWSKPEDAIACLKGVIAGIQRAGTDTMDTEYLYAFSLLLHQMQRQLEAFPGEMQLSSFFELYSHAVRATSLPFSGEPLKGVQLMGMLETRTLDFENVILLSCNEGLLPAAKINTSFIPFDIRRDFGLPTYRHKDSMYAYHFYRLIQRAKQVWILYSTEADQLGGGEPSRYIRQIRAELARQNPLITLKESVLAPAIPVGSPVPAVIIEKTGHIPELLQQKADKGLSASSLNTYRNCPLKFYYGEIAGIREPEETGDTIDPAILGTAVHEALNKLFSKVAGNRLGHADLDDLEKIADEEVSRAFKKKFRGSDIRYGKNLLLVSVAKLMVRRFLRFQLEEIDRLSAKGQSLVVRHLEKYLEMAIPLTVGGREWNVKLKGIIDRIDSVGGQTRIIDYKTGNVQVKNVRVKQWEDLMTDTALNEAFQLLFYTFLYSGGKEPDDSVDACIFPLRRVKDGFLPVMITEEKEGEGDTVPEESADGRFQGILRSLLNGIFDLSQPFVQTSDPETCHVCPYINLCLR